MVNKERMINEFKNLIKFDSESFKELDISLYLFNKLKSLGLKVKIDDAGHKLYDNPKATGNIYGYLEGDKDLEPIILSSHMDTVSPGINKEAIIENDIAKSKGESVLGADDITGIVTILEVLTIIKEKKLRHPDIEVVFFIAEEAYCKGSSLFDYSILKSRHAYVFDLAGDVGTIAISAPSIVSIKITIEGKAAHAGFEPEKGISAILAYARFISKLKMGRIDSNTTLNIGTVEGGSGKNIIPNLVISEGEIRGMNDSKIKDIIDELADLLEKEVLPLGAKYKFEYNQNISSYKIDENNYVVRQYKKALNGLGYGNPKLIDTFGGSDNNNFNKNGIEGIVISNAMNKIHTKEEYFLISELLKSVNITLKLMTMED